MNKWRSFCLGFAFSLISLVAMAEEQAAIKPQLLLSEIIQGMPNGEKQEVRVLTASFKPRDKTPLPSDCVCLGRRIHAGDGGARSSHGES
jgi:hypothetical protein